jgi:hypothetical protein
MRNEESGNKENKIGGYRCAIRMCRGTPRVFPYIIRNNIRQEPFGDDRWLLFLDETVRSINYARIAIMRAYTRIQIHKTRDTISRCSSTSTPPWIFSRSIRKTERGGAQIGKAETRVQIHSGAPVMQTVSRDPSCAYIRLYATLRCCLRYMSTVYIEIYITCTRYIPDAYVVSFLPALFQATRHASEEVFQDRPVTCTEKVAGRSKKPRRTNVWYVRINFSYLPRAAQTARIMPWCARYINLWIYVKINLLLDLILW